MGLILSGLAAAAVAMSPLSPVTITAADEAQVAVATADLDLSQARDVARLERRIESAVNRVCAVDGRMTLAQQDWMTSCRDVASSSARSHVDRMVAAARRDGTVLAAR